MIMNSPKTEGIGKRKAHKRYEFVYKVSVAASCKGGGCVEAMALHEDSYDDHLLSNTLFQVDRIEKTRECVFV